MRNNHGDKTRVSFALKLHLALAITSIQLLTFRGVGKAVVVRTHVNCLLYCSFDVVRVQEGSSSRRLGYVCGRPSLNGIAFKGGSHAVGQRPIACRRIARSGIRCIEITLADQPTDINRIDGDLIVSQEVDRSIGQALPFLL